MKADLREVLICEKDSQHIYCLFNYDFEKSREVKKLLSTILLKIKEYLMGFDQYEVTIGIGTEKKEFGEIRFSILEAYRAVCNRMRYGTGRLIYFDSISGADRQQDRDRFEELRDEIAASVEACDRESLESCIGELFNNGHVPESSDMTRYYELAEKLVDTFYAQLNLNQEEAGSQKKELLEKCQHCYKLPQMVRLLKQNLGDCLEMLRTLAETPVRQTDPPGQAVCGGTLPGKDPAGGYRPGGRSESCIFQRPVQKRDGYEFQQLSDQRQNGEGKKDADFDFHQRDYRGGRRRSGLRGSEIFQPAV